jgi:hypothetical protein
MLKKVEKKIGHWCNRWLSLGGRYILMKSVLEIQPVYWMSLAAIPYTVLNKLRKVMFNFLWNGNSETHHYHLCRWETLSKPKKYGGWGFHNIFHFNKALACEYPLASVNARWNLAQSNKRQIPSFTTVINWFRSTSFHQKRLQESGIVS